MSPMPMVGLPGMPNRFDHSTLSRLLAALIDRIEYGVLACGPDGMLYHANVAAQRKLDEERVLRVVDGRVRCTGVDRDVWSGALHEATFRMRSRLISLASEGGRLIVALMPVHIDGIETPAAVALMGRRSVCSPLGLEMLASAHGLTHAERRVLRALVDNSSVREIAALHGVAVTTIRTQIKAVRDKLNVRSIDALLLRAAEIPPITARH